MTVLPIVERELRVAARKRSVFVARGTAALVALVFCFGFLVLRQFGGGGAVSSLGGVLFMSLSWLSLGACLSAGLFLTSDCISEEKREGTIGLLFLTDLKGYDVILGKLAATSIQGVFSLLAVLPIMAVPILLGGVTGAQLMRTGLCLLLTLATSLGWGLLVSTLSRESQRAMGITLGGLFVLSLAGYAIDAGAAAVGWFSSDYSLRFTSPAFLLTTVNDQVGRDFWWGCLVQALLGLTCLAAASWWVSRSWRPGAATERRTGSSPRSSQLDPAVEARRRGRFLDQNPVLWLILRERRYARVIWVVTLMVILTAIGAWTQLGSNPGVVWVIASGFGLLVFFLYWSIASLASRFFIDARSSGLLELLLASPLTVTQILRGPIHAWLRVLAFPLGLWLMFQTILSFQSTSAAMGAASGAKTATSGSSVILATTNSATPSTGAPTKGFSARVVTSWEETGANFWFRLVSTVTSMATLAANLAALAMVGLWMGLITRRHAFATFKTLLFVQVIPWLVISFTVGIGGSMVLMFSQWAMPNSAFASVDFMRWYPMVMTILPAALAIAKDVGFILWAKRRLTEQLRVRGSGPLPT